MTIRVETKELYIALKELEVTIIKKEDSDNIARCYFELYDESIVISSKNSLLRASVEIEANYYKSLIDDNVIKTFSISIKPILSVLKNVLDSYISFEINKSKRHLILKLERERYEFKYNIIDPEINKLYESGDSIAVIESKLLYRGMNKVKSVIANDKFREGLNGINFDFNKNGITFIATDAHQLIEYKSDLFSTIKDTNFILNKVVLKMLMKLLKGKSTLITIRENVKSIIFIINKTSIIIPKINLSYVDYKKIIPTSKGESIILSRKHIIDKLKVLSVFRIDVRNMIELEFKENQLILSSPINPKLGFGSYSIDVDGYISIFKIYVNGTKLINLLNILKSDKIKLNYYLPEKPISIHAVEDKDDDTNLLILLMQSRYNPH